MEEGQIESDPDQDQKVEVQPEEIEELKRVNYQKVIIGFRNLKFTKKSLKERDKISVAK